MKGLRSIVPLSRDSLRGIEPAPIVGAKPVIEWVNPRDLFVEESYQRDVGANGIALIRRIVAEFSWHKFKTPICFRAAEFDGAIVVIDGQHTAIGCATRGIELIPVAVYENATEAERAAAFVAHNRDRVALTMQAIFKADLAGGDATAVAANAACEEAGAKILTHAINLALERPVGETMAVGTVRAIVKKYGGPFLARVMKVLVAAKRGPIKAQEISAVALILQRNKTPNVDARLTEIVASRTAKRWASLGANESGTLPQALMTLWLRELNDRIAAVTKREPGPAASAPPPVKQTPPPVKQRTEIVKPAEPVRPTYSAPPPPPPPPPRKPAGVVFLAQANGISVTLDGAIARTGQTHTVNVGKIGAKLVARLVSVMPAQIGFDRLANHVFMGDANPRQKLDDLVACVNPDLRKIGLEIFHVRASGYMIREMAKIGENLLRA